MAAEFQWNWLNRPFINGVVKENMIDGMNVHFTDFVYHSMQTKQSGQILLTDVIEEKKIYPYTCLNV